MMQTAESVTAFLIRRARAEPTRVGWIRGDVRWTYGALLDRVRARAAALRAHGVGMDSTVLGLVADPVEVIVDLFATEYIGARILACDPRAEGGFVREAARALGATLALVEPPNMARCAEGLRGAGVALLETTAIPDAPTASADRAPVDPQRPLLYLYTSGSIGGLKRVCRTTANLLAEGTAFARDVGLTPADATLCAVPLWHSYGLGNGFLSALVAGAPLVLLEETPGEPVPFAARVPELCRLIDSHRPRALVAVPFQYRLLAEAASIGAGDFDGLRWCFSSGGPLPPETFGAFVDRFGLPIRQIYGSTETGTISVNLEDGPAFRSTSVGRPVGETRLRVAGPDGASLPHGEIGEVRVAGPALPIAGYDAAPPDARLAFCDGWYRTGDLGRLDARGCLTIVQRKRSFIEVGGDKVVVAEVESALNAHPAVVEAAVVGVDAVDGGQAVKAVLVCREPVPDEALVAWCTARLAEHKIPALFERRDALPRTPLGKLERRALRSDATPVSHRLTIDHSGALGRLGWRACALTPPGPGEVQIEVRAVGLNFLDVLSALGVIPDDAPGADAAGPRLGSECAGRVVAVGAGVDRLAVGQPVIAIALGALRRHITVPASLVAPRPDGLELVEAAALPVASVTAWYALRHVARLASGERVLIHAATGGVGLAAVQIARWIGAEIVATAGSPAKRDLLRGMGIAHVFDSRDVDFDAGVREATAGQGVDVVLNSLGGAFIDRSFGLLRDGGRFVELGKKDYYADRPLGLRPFLRGLQFSLVDLRGMIHRCPEQVGELLGQVVALAEQGVLRPRIDREVPGAEVIDAFRSMQAAEHIGKIVIRVDDPAIQAKREVSGPGAGSALAAVPPPTRRRYLVEAIRRCIEAVRRTTIERLDAAAPLSSHGLDSLSSVALTRELGALVGAPLPSTFLWDHPTLNQLVEGLLERLETGSGAASSRSVEPVPPAIADPDEPIAIVSLACRFPGGIDSPDALWDLLERGDDVLGPFPSNRGWDLKDRFDPDAGAVGGIVTERAGFLSDPGAFDPAHFGISDHEAMTLDPQHRLLLELAWEAFERAGLPPDRQAETATGVFVGTWHSGYGSRAATHGAVDGHPLLGGETSLAAGRLAYTFGLRGPAIALDTACSSSLVALHLACQSMRAGECARALVGGSTIHGDLASFIAFSRMRVLSPQGVCRPFAAGADGAVWSEGAGLVLLERLSDARRAGHPVLALIRGSAINQDGRTQGLTAPSGSSQQQVIGAALAAARMPADGVDFVEAHGTGTILGDSIEAAALGATYGRVRGRSPIRVGAVKANLGHTQAAAGIAGLLKVVLALRHQRLPATPHIDAPSPELGWDEGRLELLTTSIPWPPGERPRRAAVSSFGVSGTNAHVIIEEPPADGPAPREGQPPTDVMRPSLPLVLSGSSAAGVRAQAARWVRWLREAPNPDVSGLRRTAALHRSHLAYRTAIQTSTVDETVAALEALSRDGDETAAPIIHARDRSQPVFVFSGHGGQWPAMGRALLVESDAFARAVDACDGALRPHTGWSVRAVLRGDAEAPAMDRVEVLQPTLFAMGLGLASVWQSFGVEPGAVLGHSVGEIAAAVVAGALTLEDAAWLVAARGRAIANVAQRGGMLAVALSPDALAERLGAWSIPVDLAVVNTNAEVVVSGDIEATAALAERLRAERVFCRAVDIGFAAHSHHMDGAVADLRRAPRALHPRSADVPFFSGVVGGRLDGACLDSGYWMRNVRDVVRFDRAVAALVDDGYDTFIELGGHPVLQTALGTTTAERGAIVGSLHRGAGGLGALHRNLGALHAQGGRVDFTRLFGTGRPVPAPTQAFVRRRFWLDAPGPAAARPASARPALDEDEVVGAIHRIVADASRLSVDALDDDGALFDLGLESIALISITGALRSRFGVALEVAELLQQIRTVGGLVRHVLRHRATPQAAARAAVTAPASRADRTLPAHPAATLGPGAQGHLDGVVRRLHAKTPGSRAAASPGGALADPRGTAGWYPDMPEAAAQAWAALEPTRYPLVVRGAAGAHIEDVDGNRYVDLCMGFGVHLFGHSPPFLTEAIEAALRRGAAVGPLSHLAADVARRLAALTGMDRVAFCNTGSEAVSMALRVARARTGRQRIALTVGAYHGTGEAAVGNTFLKDGAHAATLAETITITIGDPQAFETLERHRDELAAVLVEPVQSSRPDLADGDFLRALRERTRAWGVALIFDEVLIGFRLGVRGAQGRYGVDADLVTYGKLVGGGLPIGVLAGRGSWLDWIDGGARRPSTTPTTPRVLFGGTFSKNPLTMAGAQAVMARLERDGEALSAALEQRTGALAGRLNAWFRAEGFDARVVTAGSLFRFLLPPGGELLGAHLLLRGVYTWEGRSCFLSEAHTEADIDSVIAAVQDACLEMRRSGFWSGRAAPVSNPRTGPMTGGERRPIPRECLTRLRQGSGPPIVLLPGIEGSLASLLSLARRLPGALNILGLEDPGHVEPGWQPTSIDGLAQRYLAALEPALGDAPVRLVGYSFGGRVALALAAALIAAGRRIERVFLLDEAVLEGYGEPVDWRSMLDRLCAGLGLPSTPLAELSTLGRARALEHLGRQTPVGVDGLSRRLDVALRNHRLAAAWTMPDLECPVTVLRVADDRSPTDLGWGATLDGPVDACVVPGDHVSMMQPPAVEAIAERIGVTLTHRIHPPSREGEAQ